MELTNEFASVVLERDDTGNGPRLKITDRKSGQSRYFDPLELESLVWAPDAFFERLVDPEQRWGTEPNGS